MKSYIKDYPRPQFVRSNWTNLNGAWDFAFDDKNEGELKKWFEKFKSKTKITVPYTYETAMSGIGDETVHNNVWYNKILTLNDLDVNKNKLMLHFEGSDYITKVWVNGIFVGAHKGGYARFSFDITNCVKAGENRITVKVEDSLDEQQPRGKQRWVDENFGCWYVQTTGIWKTVWLESVPKTNIVSVKMTPDLPNKKLDIEALVCADAFGEALQLEIAVTFGDQFINSVKIPVIGKNVKTTIDMYNTSVDEWGIRAWSPENPNLYDIAFRLVKGNEISDTILSYVGMRSISITGDKINLNGRPIYQRLILDQGYWKDSHLTPPSEEALIEDIDKIMQLGYNGLRKHQKTEDERFLYWCDVKGMLVWSEVPATYKFSDEAVDNFTTEWMEIVRQNYNHPSIITWTPFNESWGVPDIKNNKTQQKFTEAIYYLTKTYDENRPVIVNDGWEHTISDIITLHDYEEIGEVLFNRYTEQKEDILANKMVHSDYKTPFAEGYSYKGQPIIISEFGGIAFNNDDSGWGYGNKVQTAEAFLARFDSITTAIKKLPYVCGYCYTQVSDVQQEINGLMDIERNFKINASKIKEVNERKVLPQFKGE